MENGVLPAKPKPIFRLVQTDIDYLLNKEFLGKNPS